ncbi:putative transcriptional elongation regulator MINIYO [Cocos nucifera]|uniref:Putative transcriptional elongation regulator MINIYO n=1 Tax=Cocos nucifera TaxID=13894 RepID=A0A8K0MZ03_COCNU|nr:putative transcriptional elongation regulator MINIYO [Cocos nucifera]
MEAAEKDNKTRPPPSSSSRKKKVVEIRGTAVSLKQRVEELHHAPGLVGSIVEKGFSSSDDYKPQQKPVSFPHPTVLPFPVARHRSHGPHWAPASSPPDAADGDDMEEEKDETDYDPIASFANPIERKEKKGLDLSKWKELMRDNNAAMPQSKKNGIARKAGDVNAANKEEAKKESLPSATSPPKELLCTSSQAELTTRVEHRPSNQGSPSLMDETAARAEQKPVPMDVELEASVPGGRGSVSLMDDIDAENLARLKEMSADEIAEAQVEIMEKMDPSLIEMLKKRGQNKLGRKKGADMKREGGWHDLGSAKPVGGGKSSTSAVPPGNWLPFGEHNNISWKVWSERVEKVRGLRFSLEGNVMVIDSTQKQSNGQYNVENVAERDFLRTEGDPAAVGYTINEAVALSRSMCRTGQYNVENVAERDFLRTEGDPAAVGYTINEAVALSRSMVPGQRVLALQLLASVLNKALQYLQSKDSGYNMDMNPVDKLVDWQAVWAFALGPEPQLALSLRRKPEGAFTRKERKGAFRRRLFLGGSLKAPSREKKEKAPSEGAFFWVNGSMFWRCALIQRVALDDNHDSVVLACAKVLQSILSCEINENFFNIKEKSATQENNICTAPVFRMRPEVDGGFLHGGYWKYNTKPSNIIPYAGKEEDEESEGRHTIQDDIVVAGQDIAAGLIRMGILPRICYLMEMDPLPTLQECLVSILVALARHSPTCADAIIRCPRLVRTIIDMFTKQSMVGIHPSHIKAVVFLKVLSQSSKQICLDFVKHGIFQQAMWHCPPTFDKLIENNVLGEFTSITREAYLVLEALARRLPILHSREQLEKQAMDFSDGNMEYWSWSHVVPMVDLASNWLCIKIIPYVSSLIGGHRSRNHVQDPSASCMLWVISAILHMLCSIFDRIAPEDANDMSGTYNHLPWLPHFVPKVALEIIKNGFLDFLGSNNMEHGTFPSEGGSLAESLCYLRQQNNVDASLASVSCLQGLVRLASSVDRSIQRAKITNYTQARQVSNSGIADKILEEGIVKWAQNDLTRVLTAFMTLMSSEWPVVQSIEMFGRGGPAPGIGFGWGSSGGGFWSMNVLLAQADALLILDLLKILPAFVGGMKPVLDKPADALILQRISSLLGVCLVAGPGDRVAMEKALDILLHAPVLKCLSLCIHHYVYHNKGLKSFDWQYGEGDYLFFSRILNSHFRNRWLSIKKKPSEKMDRNNHSKDISRKGDALETIYEEVEQAETTVKYPYCNSLFVEWAHQKLPLPGHWFLSAICSIGEINTRAPSSTDVLDVAKSGLFFLLGLEAASAFLCSDSQSSPISGATLVWKFHALSMALHANMDVLEDKSRDVFETLQELYGQHLDQLRHENIRTLLGRNEKIQVSSATLPEAQENCNLKLLNFQTEVHESYSTFVENLIEQFAAISYGDVIYGRQVALYLHRTVEATVRLAAWNVLSNAHVLELLPPLEKCIAEAEGYLEPVEDHEGILEAYVKSWISGGLDRAAARGSVSFTIALHHLACFIFKTNASDKLVLRNRLAKSLLRSYSRKQHHEGMLLSFIRHGLSSLQEPQYNSEIAKRFELLKEACEGSSSLLAVVEKLKSAT